MEERGRQEWNALCLQTTVLKSGNRPDELVLASRLRNGGLLLHTLYVYTDGFTKNDELLNARQDFDERKLFKSLPQS